MIHRLLLAATLLLAAQPVWADQLAYLSKPDAERALALIQDAKAIRTFCAPCHEKTSVFLKVATAELSEIPPMAGSDDPTYWSLSVNHQGLDLAYTYVPIQSGLGLSRLTKWRNVARILSLPASDVPEFLSESQVAPGAK